jgi:hypothetical protein
MMAWYLFGFGFDNWRIIGDVHVKFGGETDCKHPKKFCWYDPKMSTVKHMGTVRNSAFIPDTFKVQQVKKGKLVPLHAMEAL